MTEGLRALLKTIFAGTFGSEAGRAGYPIAARPSVAMAVTAIVIVGVVLAAIRLSVPRIRGQRHKAQGTRQNEWIIVSLWLAIGFAVQLALSNLAYAPLGRIVESKNANGFYFVSQQYSASDLLSRFHEIAKSFPLHARANLPGKTLLFDALSSITSSTTALAYLIILLSNLGGVLIYLIAKEWFKDSLTAFYALVLYLFLPAKIYFFPLLNVVSPVLMLLVLWLATRALASRHPAWLVAVGVALCGLFIFEPLPLAALPVGAALALPAIASGELKWSQVSVMTAWIVAAFVAIYLSIRAALGFDLVSAFLFALEDARAFNEFAQRPYGVWLVHNLKDFVINMGLAQSLIFMVFSVMALRGLVASPESRSNRELLLPVTFLAVLLLLDLTGVNRGETARLWIFLGVLMQLFVARACASWKEGRLFAPIVAISLVQTAICVEIVAWIIP